MASVVPPLRNSKTPPNLPGRPSVVERCTGDFGEIGDELVPDFSKIGGLRIPSTNPAPANHRPPRPSRPDA
jgi:hypothetical protein